MHESLAPWFNGVQRPVHLYPVQYAAFWDSQVGVRVSGGHHLSLGSVSGFQSIIRVDAESHTIWQYVRQYHVVNSDNATIWRALVGVRCECSCASQGRRTARIIHLASYS